MQQPLKIDAWDFDVESPDYLGGVETSLGAIVGSAQQTLILDLKDKRGNAGKVILRSEEVKGTMDSIYLELAARGVEDVEVFSKSDPFLTISKLRPDNTWARVHQTEYIPNNLNPIWRGFQLPVSSLCGGDFFRPIRFEIYDHEDNGRHKFIGALDTTMNDILLHGGRTFPFINPQKASKKKYRDSGNLVVRSAYLIKEFSFLQFLQGNCGISLMLAVDFTASNGVPTSPSSLHYLDPRAMNEYERAIASVGEILMNYDQDKLVPVWGFGGSPVHGAPTSHCFPINGNPSNPEVLGVGGILQAYRNCLSHVYLNGPTLFQHILRTAMEIASRPWRSGSQNYYILMILTDGEIHDFAESVNLIVQASELPLSIIIVGVGKSSFGAMENLDADGQGLKNSRGQKAARDIVQFVPFRKFDGNAMLLAKEVLAEVPKQLTGFMKSKGIEPIPRQVVPMANIAV
mmetsp:Transcript_13122/g.24562  ORF Transcript_13122/g.24562 Transcript_13122/m.24562 type:complete len:459 (+) Transcript_13122:223-1599(+)